jgi:hypothetical protein
LEWAWLVYIWISLITKETKKKQRIDAPEQVEQDVFLKDINTHRGDVGLLLGFISWKPQDSSVHLLPKHNKHKLYMYGLFYKMVKIENRIEQIWRVFNCLLNRLYIVPWTSNHFPSASHWRRRLFLYCRSSSDQNRKHDCYAMNLMRMLNLNFKYVIIKFKSVQFGTKCRYF